MKRRFTGIVICAVGIALAIAAAALLSPTPQAGEQAPGPVRLSRGSGFYDDVFFLKMACETGEIRYTLDSSDPEEHSLLYTGPIEIGDASLNDNVYSLIPEVSLDLCPEKLAEEGYSPKYGYRVPSRPVDKATVVRAVCYDAFGKRSEEVCAVYFVGFGAKKAYDGIGIIAITTDPANLFDYEKGIYVLGKTYDESDTAQREKKTPLSYRFWPANYTQKGRAWEREASVTLFDADRQILFSGRAGIRTQGQAGRGMLPKSFNIYAREKYGTSTFPGDALFGLDYPLTRLNLNSGSNGMDNKLTDDLVNCLVGVQTYDTRPYRPYQLFLDGEYWGVYWLTPRYKPDYFDGTYGLSEEDVVMVTSNGVEVGREADWELFESMVAFIAQSDMSDPEQYAAACALIDIDSCVDYYATQLYIANIDWPEKNKALWRVREPSDGPYADGKWRWMLFDVNRSMGLGNAKRNITQRVAGIDPMFCSLLENGDFVQTLHERQVRLARETFAPEKTDAFIEDFIELMGGAMENEYLRFHDGELTRADFAEKCRTIGEFFRQRHDYILEKYGDAGEEQGIGQ